jgi:hypothetical protein
METSFMEQEPQYMLISTIKTCTVQSECNTKSDESCVTRQQLQKKKRRPFAGSSAAMIQRFKDGADNHSTSTSG